MSSNIVIVNGARTPFGSFGGGLASQSATDLGVAASIGAVAKSKVSADKIDQVVMGNVLQTSKDSIYLARHVALRSGFREDCAGLALNQLCGSGVRSIADAAMLIDAKQAGYVLAGGTESLSQTPYMSWNIRWGGRMGLKEIWDGLDIRDTYIKNASMGETAENLQAKYSISREEQDRYALSSQLRAKAAAEAGKFAEEIVPVEVKGAKGKLQVIDKDEHPRPESTIEGLAGLKPVFKADGTVTAGNSCGIVDGAAAVVVTTYEQAEKDNLAPLGRVVSWAVVGVPPEIMGIGPVPAIPQALRRANLDMSQIGLVEINEAFASQYLACEKELKLDRERVNVNGGSIALGHPFAASGTRLVLSMLLELKRRKEKYGVVSLCIGGGMGIAMVLESL